jgi:molecular chaperone DnaK
MKGDDKDDITARSGALAEVSGKLAERVYKQQSASGGDGTAGEGAASGADVVDAEFEEVDKDRK